MDSFKWFLCNDGDGSVDVCISINSLLVPRTCCFNGIWHEDVRRREVRIFGSLSVCRFATLLAADPAWVEVASVCESAQMSGMVSSHAMGFPLDHEKNVTMTSSIVFCGHTKRFLWKELELL